MTLSSFTLMLRKTSSHGRIWKISYDSSKVLRRAFGVQDGKLQESTNDLSEMNENEARGYVARLVKSKIKQGYEVDPGSKLPKWVDAFEIKSNEALQAIEQEEQSQDQELVIELIKDNNRVWSVQVSGDRAIRRWGSVGGKKTTSERFYGEGKGRRTPNQQARFEAVREAKKKQDLGYVAASSLSSSKTNTAMTPNPMLAYNCNVEKLIEKEKGLVFVQPKLDGLRCVADLETGTLYSRTRKPFETMEHIARQIRHTPSSKKEGIRYIDGELYRHEMSIQTLNSIVRSGASSSEDRETVQFHIFDCFQASPFETRWGSVIRWHQELHDSNHLMLTPTEECDVDQLLRKHDEMTSLGYEGIMVRRKTEQPYAIGKRSMQLQKLKRFQVEEYRCIDILPQQHVANDDEMVAGAFVMELPQKLTKKNGERTFHATPKASHAEKREMWVNRELYKTKQYLGIIQFFEYSTDKVPRFPILLGFRHVDDK